MKELVQFNEKDQEMIDAFRALQEECKRVSSMWDARFKEVADAWSKHRKEIITELGGSDSPEYDRADRFFGCIWDMSAVIKAQCSAIADDTTYEHYLRYIKPNTQ